MVTTSLARETPLRLRKAQGYHSDDDRLIQSLKPASYDAFAGDDDELVASASDHKQQISVVATHDLDTAAGGLLKIKMCSTRNICGFISISQLISVLKKG